jgi:hypothetical protein
MKAILVIDVDDVSLYHADVYKNDDKGNGDLIMNYLPFKPMPKKLTEADISWSERRGFRGGWNACLDEITGETE